uniref:Uncharacterized protein n=1 Tax=Romanomermis culicivorax TaxID=13658 RepID=A0A915J773_ROMCU
GQLAKILQTNPNLEKPKQNVIHERSNFLVNSMCFQSGKLKPKNKAVSSKVGVCLAPCKNYHQNFQPSKSLRYAKAPRYHNFPKERFEQGPLHYIHGIGQGEVQYI